MKQMKILVLIFAAAFLLAGCDNAPQSTGLDTPEKAVSAYVAAIAAGDLNAAMALCPADTMIKNFHADAYNKIKPVTGKTENADEIKLSYTRQTAAVATSLLWGEAAAAKESTPVDAAWTEQLLKGQDGSKLKDLKAVRIDKPYKTGYNLEADSDVYKEATKADRLVWGADDYTERIALLQHDGKTYMAGFTLVAYGGTWGICTVSSATAGLPATGIVREMGQDEYLKHVKPSATASK